MYREEEFEVRPNRKPKYVLDTTNSNSEYKRIEALVNDPWSERGCWWYKKALNNWKVSRRYQWRS